MQVKSDLWNVRWQDNPVNLYSKLHIPNTLYQVLEFKDMEQFRKFCQCEAANHEIFRQVGARMIALRMSCCLQKIDLCQDKVKEFT